MRTIIDNAVSVLREGIDYTNHRIILKFIGKRDEHYELFSLKTYALNEARSNPNFVKWLFYDPGITFFGKSLSGAQREEYITWLHDL